MLIQWVWICPVPREWISSKLPGDAVQWTAPAVAWSPTPVPFLFILKKESFVWKFHIPFPLNFVKWLILIQASEAELCFCSINVLNPWNYLCLYAVVIYDVVMETYICFSYVSKGWYLRFVHALFSLLPEESSETQ